MSNKAKFTKAEARASEVSTVRFTSYIPHIPLNLRSAPQFTRGSFEVPHDGAEVAGCPLYTPCTRTCVRWPCCLIAFVAPAGLYCCRTILLGSGIGGQAVLGLGLRDADRCRAPRKGPPLPHARRRPSHARLSERRPRTHVPLTG